MNQEETIKHLMECRQSGIDYRDLPQFRRTWEELEGQIRCVPPVQWDMKEDWQTKIFIPLQAKKREIAKSYLKKMIFGKKRNFDIIGSSAYGNIDEAQMLVELVEKILDKGMFDQENDFVLQEAVDIGTSFIKIGMKEDGKGLKFTWRTPYQVIFDPETGQNLQQARFIGDLFRKDIRYIIAQAKASPERYNPKVVQQFLDDKAVEADTIIKQNATSSISNKEPMMQVNSIDGTQDMTIPSKYQTVDIDEDYWLKPTEDGGYEETKSLVLQGKYILSEDKNVFDFKPIFGCRVKPRKYDYYGLGYLENARGLQDLMNSCVNLGFDSLKISSMDIIVINDNLIKDSTTIKYKPLAVWKMKDINAVKIQRQPVSAITDILRGITLIDQIDQDASGVARQMSGGTSPGKAAGNESDTLGEYQAQMQMLDQRFLDVGRFIENDYFLPLVKAILKIIFNPKLFNQSLVDYFLGFNEVDNIEVVDGQATINGKKKVPRLDLAKARKHGEESYDVKIVGITHFAGNLELLAKLKEAMEVALKFPALGMMTKIDALWNRLWQVSEIDDYQDFIRTKDEVEKMMGGMGGQPGQGGQPGGAPGIPPKFKPAQMIQEIPIPGMPMPPQRGGKI